MSAPRLPESCAPLRSHFRGALVAVDEWHCPGHDPATPLDEWSSADVVALTRRGVWSLEVQGEWHVADAGAVTFWRAHEEYRVRHPVAGGDACTVLRLTDAGSQALASLPPLAANVSGRDRRRSEMSLPWLRRSAPASAAVDLLHRQVLTQARHAARTADTVGLEERGLALWHAVVHEAHEVRTEPSRAHRALAAAAREVVAARHREPLRVPDVAEAVGCSAFHLSRLYRGVHGESLHRTLTRIRLREAFERLLDEPTNLSRIALDTGFASHSHLTDAVRAEYGVPPTELRRMLTDANAGK